MVRKHSVFKRLALQTRKNQGLFWKGLKICLGVFFVSSACMDQRNAHRIIPGYDHFAPDYYKCVLKYRRTALSVVSVSELRSGNFRFTRLLQSFFPPILRLLLLLHVVLKDRCISIGVTD